MKKSRASKTSRKLDPRAITITKPFLKKWSLPEVKDSDDKEARGRVLVIAGSQGMPGAVVLAATAALRAGAGKLQVATPACIAESVALQIPEALVIGLSETKPGIITTKALNQLADKIDNSDAILIGPGMDSTPQGKRALSVLVEDLLKHMKGKTIVLDASALECIHDNPKLTLESQCDVVITPHAGEMASFCSREKEDILRSPSNIASQIAKEFGITVVLKGAETFIADSSGALFRNITGNAGLGTSGSGDVLAGVIAGLAARGASAAQASVWGVYLHAASGDRLAKEIGPVGYLARELLLCIPKESANLAR